MNTFRLSPCWCPYPTGVRGGGRLLGRNLIVSTPNSKPHIQTTPEAHVYQYFCHHGNMVYTDSTKLLCQ